MTVKIESKIVSYEVVKEDAAPRETASEAPAASSTANIIQMHEKVERPEMLLGSTYKVKTPLTEHALYVTINDIGRRSSRASVVNSSRPERRTRRKKVKVTTLSLKARSSAASARPRR
jgi:hypothetical protein